MNKLMRLFVAINFTEDNKACLYQTMQELKKHTIKGNFTHKENLHLTLAFLGETKELENVKVAMDHTVTKLKTKKFSVVLEGLGKFKRKEGDIYWIGVKKNQLLSDLNKTLVSELKKYVYDVDEGEFKPHLTLGRRIVVQDGFDISLFEKSIPSMIVEVERISLMKSERIEGKLIYTEIYDSKLQ